MAKWVKLRPAEVERVMHFLARCSPRGPAEVDELDHLHRRLAAAIKDVS